MPEVPQHSVVWRLPNQSSLAVKLQTPEQISDSAIIIKMLSAAVCGTDLAILSGTRPGRAEILGHEGVGVVLYAPEQCGVSKGERVIINPVHHKRPEIVIGHSRDGVFRGLFWIDAADALDGRLLVSCPKECLLEDAELALAEPLASVLYSLELLREHCGTTPLLIRGSGTVGILAAKLWTTLTGSYAIVVSQSEEHARWLRDSTRWPANVRICCSADLTNVIGEGSSGLGPKAAILCCSRECATEGLRLLMDVAPEGATIDLMAGFPAEHREGRLGGVNLDAIRWNNICGVRSSPPAAFVDRSTGKTTYLVGHRGTAERHILHAIDLLSRRVISIADVPHRRLTLEELPGAVKQMLATETRHTTKWVKAVVVFPQQDGGELNGAC
ncbi:MAG: alcohol dehydrogenase catalytic domain-containing protein [Terriglobales bacterium]|jgi:2-epi-valiolone-7-phosphate 1-reductase